METSVYQGESRNLQRIGYSILNCMANKCQIVFDIDLG